MTRIVLIRHAASTREAEGMWSRLYDAPIIAGAWGQIADTAFALRRVDIDRVISSPLLRCTQTAAMLFPHHHIDILPELRAYHSGVLDEKTTAAVARDHPEYVRLSFAARFLNPRFNEESMSAQTLRIVTGLAQVLDNDAQVIAVVTHFSCINVIAQVAAGDWNIAAHASGAYDVPYGGYLTLDVERDKVLAGIRKHISETRRSNE